MRGSGVVVVVVVAAVVVVVVRVCMAYGAWCIVHGAWFMVYGRGVRCMGSGVVGERWQCGGVCVERENGLQRAGVWRVACGTTWDVV